MLLEQWQQSVITIDAPYILIILTNMYVSGTILILNNNHCISFLRGLCSSHADEKTEAECAYVSLFQPLSRAAEPRMQTMAQDSAV